MAGTKNHDFHILDPDYMPFLGSVSALTMTSGGVMAMHPEWAGGSGKYVLLLGFAGVLLTMFLWWTKVVREANQGHHTPVDQLHLRYGMITFIASEVMFFVGWFWAFFDFSLFPSTLSEVTGGQFPSKAIEAIMDPFDLPLACVLSRLFDHRVGTLLLGGREQLVVARAEAIAMLELARNGPGKVLHDRPRGVRAELVATREVELLNGT